MATAGPNQAGTVAEIDDFNVAWTNPSNATVDNDSYATAALDVMEGVYSNYLRFTNFGFALTGSETITSVQIEVACLKSAGTIALSSMQLIKAGSPAGSDVSPSLNLSSSETYVSYTGTVVGNWGTTLSGTDVNSSSFGVQVMFQVSGGVNGTVSVDACRITLTYSGGAASLLSRTTTCFAG